MFVHAMMVQMTVWGRAIFNYCVGFFPIGVRGLISKLVDFRTVSISMYCVVSVGTSCRLYF